jgi:hypothetical protein
MRSSQHRNTPLGRQRAQSQRPLGIPPAHHPARTCDLPEHPGTNQNPSHHRVGPAPRRPEPSRRARQCGSHRDTPRPRRARFSFCLGRAISSTIKFGEMSWNFLGRTIMATFRMDLAAAYKVFDDEYRKDVAAAGVLKLKLKAISDDTMRKEAEIASRYMNACLKESGMGYCSNFPSTFA